MTRPLQAFTARWNDGGRVLWRYMLDSLLAIIGALLVTGIIYVLRFYPRIGNISLIYLIVVLALASTRGRFAAIIASIVAFLSFDYFLVPPLYTFTIGKFDEWLALFIFLATAIITGQLASALRQRAEEASRREHETRTLYELVNATISEESLERRLEIIARAAVKTFGPLGVRDCTILLPGPKETLSLLADAREEPGAVILSADEKAAVLSVMAQGHAVDVHNDMTLVRATRHLDSNVARRVLQSEPTARRSVLDMRELWGRLNHFQGMRELVEPQQCFTRILPLQTAQRCVGVMRLLIESHQRAVNVLPSLGLATEAEEPQHTFFATFLDQATAVIEHARLHQENLQVELLQRTDALRAALLSSVSHDLRTPLASIKAAASSLLQEDVQWNEEERHSFALAIEREADRLNRLVGNLLDMSRIEGGAVKLEKEWYPLNELLHDVLGHMQWLLQGRDVSIAVPADLPPVEIDYLQMDQVLTNLVENAVRYSPADMPIEISVEIVSGEIQVSIADRGPGIPIEDIERIFDKFYRVLGVQRKGTTGSGLGLSVSRGLVEAHGGRIWAENRAGGGTVLRFTLPMGKVEEMAYE